MCPDPVNSHTVKKGDHLRLINRLTDNALTSSFSSVPYHEFYIVLNTCVQLFYNSQEDCKLKTKF